MRQSKILVLALMLATLPKQALAAGKTPSCGSDVNLVVTLSGTQSNQNYVPDASLGSAVLRIVSDGLGPYPNSRSKGDQITAIFQVDNCSYDFTTNLNFTKRKMYAQLNGDAGPWVLVTFFNFDRVASVPLLTVDGGGNFLDPNANVFCADTAPIYDPATGRIQRDANGVVHDNYGGCWRDASGAWFVRRGGGMTTVEGDNLNTALRFVTSPIDSAQNGAAACQDPSTDPRCWTSFIRVYHPTVSTWIITPDLDPLSPPDLPPSPDTWVARHSTCANSGSCAFDFQSMPFKMVVTKQ